MKWSEMVLPTLKETPSEAEAISHILMIRAGLIRKLTAGVYTYLPLGFRVLKKVENIIRQEMNTKGAQEILMPAIQPIELWQKSGRLDALGEDMISFIDRHKKKNILGPTHEEVVTTLVKNEINSYRQMPLILYQIQTKFRDEVRPRFGIIRSREFIMKDAYSFDCDLGGLDESYQKMYDAYCRIFSRCGLKTIPVEADSGVMGGDASHEFMVIAENGEDSIVSCLKCDYAASMDKAAVAVHSPQSIVHSEKLKPIEKVSTPGVSTVKDVAEFLKVKPEQLIKTLIYVVDEKPVVVLVRGDHDINEAKLLKALKAQHIVMADESIIQKVTKGPLGFSGPIGLKDITVISDSAVDIGENWVVGANSADMHFINANNERDFKVDVWADIRNITSQDQCPKCGQEIVISFAIEVGHVFKLGTKYTESLDSTYLDVHGKSNKIIMGCYGIGVTRIIAAYIEQNNDDYGISWPMSIAPFQVIIMPLNCDHPQSKQIAESLYNQLSAKGIEVLLDDRKIRAGMKFKDADLVGIPLQVIIGERNLAEGLIEIKVRATLEKDNIPAEQAMESICSKIKELL